MILFVTDENSKKTSYGQLIATEIKLLSRWWTFFHRLIWRKMIETFNVSNLSRIMRLIFPDQIGYKLIIFRKKLTILGRTVFFLNHNKQYDVWKFIINNSEIKSTFNIMFLIINFSNKVSHQRCIIKKYYSIKCYLYRVGYFGQQEGSNE